MEEIDRRLDTERRLLEIRKEFSLRYMTSAMQFDNALMQAEQDLKERETAAKMKMLSISTPETKETTQGKTNFLSSKAQEAHEFCTCSDDDDDDDEEAGGGGGKEVEEQALKVTKNTAPSSVATRSKLRLEVRDSENTVSSSSKSAFKTLGTESD